MPFYRRPVSITEKQTDDMLRLIHPDGSILMERNGLFMVCRPRISPAIISFFRLEKKDTKGILY
jgi:hypothetical protein